MTGAHVRLLAVFIAAALFAAGCGDDGDASAAGDNDSTGPASVESAGYAGQSNGEPVPGGTLVFGVNSQTAGLDPVISQGSGTTGGIELAALYDTLLRWDPEERAYEPRTAESLTPDSTLAEWTLKIRPGISFGDGTSYNAEAVKINIERFLAPTSRSPHRATLAIIEEITVVNDLTVTFRLRQPWAGFPYVLTREPGMIVSPTAIATLGESLNLNPVGAGAGPFRIVSYKPDEAIVMEKNPDYWNGPVYLDGLRFVFIAGFAPRFEALDAGTLHAAFLRDAAVNARAKDAGYPGYSAIVHGAGWNINHGAPITCNGGKPEPACAGQPDGTTTSTNPPGRNPKVRQAIAAALDPEVINERVRDGKTAAGNALFNASFPWDPGVEGPQVDLDRAKQLVTDAKAEGWDGSIELKCHNGLPDLAIATQTMLQAAGMNVTVKNDYDIQAFIADALLNKNYEMACIGLAVSPNDGAYPALEQQLYSTSPTNRLGYANPAMDAALDKLRVAATDDERRAAFKAIAEIFSADVPIAVFEAVEEYVAFDPDVHGVVPTSNSVMLFDKTWIEP